MKKFSSHNNRFQYSSVISIKKVNIFPIGSSLIKFKFSMKAHITFINYISHSFITNKPRFGYSRFFYNLFLIILLPHNNGLSLLVSSKGQKIHLLFFEIIFADSVSLFYFEILLPTTYNLNIS